MKYAALKNGARKRQLNILGGFHPTPEDKTPKHCKTLLLLGPDEPDFWPAFTRSPEWQDSRPDPMDRWSTRVIGDWAKDLGGIALFPFGGPPFQPFYSWALRTGRAHSSPVQFLVHDHAGLFVSFRGALALPDQLDLPPPPPNPCNDCAQQPCKTACLSGALTATGYDVPACRAFLQTDAGTLNLNTGCAVRRACPVSRGFGRMNAQSAYHMQQFTGG
ncbi:ferredoxin [Sulfitobacter sp. F26204]|uniref:ferredoxin n=1 Tax=Sulfitobacter sp. F26204 TaxID=2996014 RepID=UPI00225E5DCE|nr:ferredoxin [Sulfitobacter sp. F26204]MCX7558722.1 ferredoxin [Sulfitobacter sp. F26204]